MLKEARSKRPHPRVVYIAGVGERIPLRDKSCDSAWLSTVVHHFSNLPAAAHELRRVLQPGGKILIRSAFPGRNENDIFLLRFFPGVQRVIDTFPDVETFLETFSIMGFELKLLESVQQTTAVSLGDFLTRVRTRADTTLQALMDQEFEDGLKRLEEAASREGTPTLVVDRLDLLVLRLRR